jgi:hypothetical protein
MPAKGSGMGVGPWQKPGENYVRKTNRPYTKPAYRGCLNSRDQEAFEYFFQVKNYEEVGRKFGVTGKAVGSHAAKHNWITRLTERVKHLDEQITEKLSDRLAKDAHRQFNIMSLVEANAVNILKKPDLANGGHVKPSELAQTAGAVETSVKTKRLIAGESTENVAFSYKDWMRKMISISSGDVVDVKPIEGPKGGS